MSCHNCAHEWGDACSRRGVHLPAQKKPCQNCMRNAMRTHLLEPTDNYVLIEEAMEQIAHGKDY